MTEHHGHHEHHEHGDGDHGHHPDAPSAVEARTLALESLLLEKGVLTSEEIDRVISMYEHDLGPMIGARLVARAWVDPAFRDRLLDDAPAVLQELGHKPTGTQLRVLENRPGVHNMVVCTLCSCYPWAVLGLPPTWYKSAPYRSRAVSEPRAVLEEFGLSLPAEVRVNVWDSSSDLRYMVLPERPAGTEGWSEEQLAAIVTRDSMIGVAVPQAAAGAPA
ncbi:MAG: nitrile hydratase subunit alpha [Candidatus Dormibacteraeota bacterium]|nr:nitrile hydratase subunit alpha [Candidatus Dormibacteraeota bacterium]